MRTRRATSPSEAIVGLVALVLAEGVAAGAGSAQINQDNWGRVAAPVYGTSQAGLYAGAELFTAPNQFDGDYYHGVLPNGRIVRPAGTSVQIGTNPLGARLTPDGRYLITSNDDERVVGLRSLQASTPNVGGYSLSVFDTRAGKVVSQAAAAGRYFIGLQVTGDGPYTVWASGGGDNDIKLFNLSAEGIIHAGSPAALPVRPVTPANEGFVSHYTAAPTFTHAAANGNLPPVPAHFGSRRTDVRITFPAGMALSPDRRFLYVACIGDDSLGPIQA